MLDARVRHGRELAIGVLLGFSAATPGVVAIAGIRPWYITTLLAFVLAVAPDPGRLARIRPRALDLAAVGYLVVTGLAEIENSKALGYAPDFTDLVAFIGFFVGYVAARSAVNGSASLGSLLAGFVLPAIPSALLGIGQTAAPAAFRFVTTIAPSAALDSRYDDASLIRATGLVGHWTGFGYYLCCIVAACAVGLVIHPQSAWRTRYMWVVMSVALIGIGATLTFGTIGVAAVLVAIVLVQSKRPVLAGAVALSGLGVGLWLFGGLIAGRVSDQAIAGRTLPGVPAWLPNTITYRIYIWVEQTIPAIGDRPITGWGSSLYGESKPGRLYPSQLDWPSAESQFLATAISYGLPALVMLVAVYLGATVSLARAARWSRTSPILSMVALSVAAMIAAITFAIVSNRGFPGAYWPLLGAVLAGVAPHRWSSRDAEASAKRDPCPGRKAELLGQAARV